ncbi:MAG: hypothetical protein M3458_13385 [Acidobacteriota bacterium]|nr:hypothetical protein [Acidobacteriota bacterium]
MPEIREPSPTPRPRECPACGAAPCRAGARFCATCGRSLDREEYLPADALLSSYHQQCHRPSTDQTNVNVNRMTQHGAMRGARKDVDSQQRVIVVCDESRSTVAAVGVSIPTVRRHRAPSRISPMPYDEHRNSAATTALALATYALVPYLGILFCPGAMLLGSIGVVRASRAPHIGGRRDAILGVVMGLVIFGAQLILWWILYKVPEWSRQDF